MSGSINVKAHIVTIDERETGLRNLVNFGHTIGHAIEAVVTPKILHGECVAIGIILEAEVSRQLGILSQVAVGRLKRALKAYGLPISITDPRIATLPEAKHLTVDRLLDIMRIDKKNSGDEKKVVLLNRIGSTHEQKASVVKDDVIRKTLSDMVKVEAGIPSINPVTMSTPGSKSISNRALVLAALASGTCRLRNLLHSDDTAVMMSSLLDLQGAKFSWEDGGETLVVEGGAGHLRSPPAGKELYIGNAGTAARFLTSVCALVRSGSTETTTTVLTGNSYMKVRPIAPLVTALTANGTAISYVEGQGCLPLAIKSDGFKGGRIQLAASISSQYVSSILLCAPYASEPVVLELTGGQVISQPYIDMTLSMMETFGIKATRDVGEDGTLLNVYRIPQGTYVNPANYNIESDASSATYPLAVAAITGTTCTVQNIGSSSLQGDAGFAKNILEPMGCTVVQTANETTVTGPPVGQLKALGEVDMETMTDAFLTASVLAAVAAGPKTVKDPRENVTRIYGIANQRVKECNRIKGMRDQLSTFAPSCPSSPFSQNSRLTTTPCHFLLARLLQRSSASRRTSLTTGSSSLERRSTSSGRARRSTATTTTVSPWPFPSSRSSAPRRSSRSDGASRRRGLTGGTISRTRFVGFPRSFAYLLALSWMRAVRPDVYAFFSSRSASRSTVSTSRTRRLRRRLPLRA